MPEGVTCSNLEGRDERRFALHAAGFPTHRERSGEVAADGYDGYVFS